MKKILIVGNGAREHVIADTLSRSPQTPEIFVVMKSKNPGLSKIASEFLVCSYKDFNKIGDFVKSIVPDFAFIGPEDPLCSGIVNFLKGLGVPSIGPIKELAKLETSKSFTRNLFEKYNIPGNAKYKVFASTNGVEEFLNELGNEYVIKPDGLTGGKGVKLSGEHLVSVNEAVKYCEEVLESHESVVIEEKLAGEEFSLQCFVDGKHIKAAPPVQDHKRLLDGDKGPNTGGMGSYSCNGHLLPFLKAQEVEAAKDIVQKTCDAIREDTGKEYKGIMYGGFILTKDGVKILEYNARLGDPEAMNILPVLKTDLVEVCEAVINGTLNELDLVFENKATVCKYIVPEGYPVNPKSGEKIEISSVPDKTLVFFAAVEEKDNEIFMTSSRALGLVGISENISDAEKSAENAIKGISGPVFHRKDIGTEPLLQKRVGHMNEIRSS